MAIVDIKTAEELIDPELEARWTTRRAARETRVFQRILRAFVDRGTPISVSELVAAISVDTPPDMVHQALRSLDADDLIRIQDGQVDVAYPFSASPTPFLVHPPAGEERYACCATDALGIAAMVGQRVEIRSRCHHCFMPLEFSVTAEGPGPEAAGVMLWFGRQVEERCRVIDSL